MTKMQEALEAWKASRNDNILWPDETFEAGYRAAIAAVKEGGVVAYEGMHTSGAPLYKLPEDDTPLVEDPIEEARRKV